MDAFKRSSIKERWYTRCTWLVFSTLPCHQSYHTLFFVLTQLKKWTQLILYSHKHSNVKCRYNLPKSMRFHILALFIYAFLWLSSQITCIRHILIERNNSKQQSIFIFFAWSSLKDRFFFFKITTRNTVTKHSYITYALAVFTISSHINLLLLCPIELWWFISSGNQVHNSEINGKFYLNEKYRIKHKVFLQYGLWIHACLFARMSVFLNIVVILKVMQSILLTVILIGCTSAQKKFFRQIVVVCDFCSILVLCFGFLGCFSFFLFFACFGLACLGFIFFWSFLPWKH